MFFSAKYCRCKVFSSNTTLNIHHAVMQRNLPYVAEKPRDTAWQLEITYNTVILYALDDSDVILSAIWSYSYHYHIRGISQWTTLRCNWVIAALSYKMATATAIDGITQFVTARHRRQRTSRVMKLIKITYIGCTVTSSGTNLHTSTAPAKRVEK